MTARVLELEGSLDLAAIPAGTASELRGQLKIRAADQLAPAQRALVTNLCVVIDCSGSMAGPKIEAAIEAAKRIVDAIDERHRISLVGFALSSRIIVDNAQATAAARDQIKAKIDKLHQLVGGSTFMGSGIRDGADLVKRFGSDAQVLVVLSDGAADDKSDALAQAARATELGIQLHAVGIGDDFEADHLRKLVTPSSGAVLAPGHLDRLAATFGELAARIESFVATNAQLAITLGPGVRARHLYKTRPQQAFIADLVANAPRVIEARVGNIERGQTYAYLVSMIVPPGAIGSLEVMRATLTFDVPSLGLRGQSQELALSVAREPAERTADVEISGAYRCAQIARLVDELADAQRRNAKDECLDRAELLIRLSDEQGDERGRIAYETLRDRIAADRAIEQKTLNEVVIASTVQPGPPAEKSGAIKQLYDVVLVAPGDAPILLLRALREVTAKPLRELNELIAMTPVAIEEALPHKAANAIVAQLEAAGTGAKLAIRRR